MAGQEGDQVTGWGRQATLPFSPYPQTTFLAKHLTALSVQKGKIKKSSQSRKECQATTFPTTLPGLKGPLCAFPSAFGGTDMSSQCGQQARSLCGHFSILSPHPPPGDDRKVQSTMNINMNKKMNLKMTGY